MLTGSTTLATGEAGEPDHAGTSLRSDCTDAVTPDTGCLTSLWWTWTAPSTGGTVMVDLCGSRWDTTLAVYTGDQLNALIPVASNDDQGRPCDNGAASRVRFVAPSGPTDTVYQIAVATYLAGTGGIISGQLTFNTGPPANDNFATATPLVADSLFGPGQTNVGATGEAGENNHARASNDDGCTGAVVPSATCTASVWYTYLAPSTPPTQAVAIDLCNSSFDTTLAVYTGSTVGSLTEIAGNDDRDWIQPPLGVLPDEQPELDCRDTLRDGAYASKVVFTATANTTYRIAVAGGGADSGSINGALTTGALAGTPLPPTATTDAATEVTTTGARLNATVDEQGGQATTYRFEYGTSTSYGSNTSEASVGSYSDYGYESAMISGLTPGTTYHFRVVATNSTGTSEGADQIFTTLSPPLATTSAASDVTGTGATLTSTVNPQGQATTYRFEYGTSTSYGSSLSDASAGSGTSGVARSAAISGLTPGTLYHFRVVATNATGTTNGADQIFTTLSAPLVTTGAASDVTGTGATLNGAVNAQGQATTYRFEYGTSTSYGSNTADADGGSGSTGQSPSAVIGGLTPGTLYHFRVVATNAAGTTNGAGQTFTTLSPPTATTGAATAVTTTGATLNATVNPQGQTTTYHFEYGTSTSYGLHTTSADGGSGSSGVARSAAIDGLTPGTTYHFRVVATNGTGATNGAVQTLTTLSLPVATTNPASDVAGTGGTLTSTVNAQGQTTTDTTPPVLRISRSPVRMRRDGLVGMALTCPASGPGGCLGRFKLTTVVTVRGGGHRRVLMALRPIAIPGDTSLVVRFRLSRKFRVLVTRRGRIRVKASATVHDEAGSQTTVVATLTLRAPRDRSPR